jgi:anti-sigma regulatory factor (Ser/Thr protein kinase)
MVDHYIFSTHRSSFSVYANAHYVEENIFQYPLASDVGNSTFFFIDHYDLTNFTVNKFMTTCFIASTRDDLLTWFKNGGVFGFIKTDTVKEKTLYYLNVMIEVFENHEKNLSIQKQESFPFSFRVYLFEECLPISDFIQKLCNQYTHKDVKTGTHELLTNAMVHGNWPLSRECQQKHRGDDLLGNMKKSFNEKLGKFVVVSGKIIECLNRNAIQITIEDMGEGFEWNPSSSLKTSYSGRGITLAKQMSFDALTYNEKGNCATGYVYLDHT